MKGPQKQRCRIGLIPAVKYGLTNAGKNAALDQYNVPRNAIIVLVFYAIIVQMIRTKRDLEADWLGRE